MHIVHLEALDVTLELETPDSSTSHALLSRLPSTWRCGVPGSSVCKLLRLAWRRGPSGEELHAADGILATAGRLADRELWLARLEQEVVWAVARGSRHLWLHAGAVSWRGAALVFPGPSYAGKSMLVDALLRLGALYLSDEWVAIDALGQVHALPRRLRLREGSSRISPGPEGEARAWPLLATAFLHYHPRPASKPEPIAAMPALAALLRHRIGSKEAGAEHFSAAAAALRRPVFAGRRAEADAFLAAWLPSLEEHSRAA